jgi:hypothetical protein
MSEMHAHTANYIDAQRPLSDAERDGFRRLGAYVEVPKEVAMRHPLYGVAGWLVVLAVFMILDTVFGGLVVLANLVLAAKGAAGSHLLFAVIQAGFVAAYIVCIVRLFAKHPGFPRLFTVMCILSLTLTGIGVLIAGFTWFALGQAIAVGIYIAYVQCSRRVRVTYRSQVDGNDPFLSHAASGGASSPIAPAPVPGVAARQFGGA